MPLRVKLKLFLKRVLPAALFTHIIALWRRTFAQFFTSKSIHDRYKTAYLAEYPQKIAAGPFAGMEYIAESAGSTYLLKLIGCYEAILHPYIESFIKQNYQTIIDIGCAEGYYLVGLGRQLPSARLIGYDIDPKAITLTKELAQQNQLANDLSVKANCTSETLTQDITDQTLLICDAEGFEATILDPETTLSLKHVQTFLIETHDFAAPGVVALLKDRFASTHTIETVMFSTANPATYPFLASMSNKQHQYDLLRERGEQEQEWLIMERK